MRLAIVPNLWMQSGCWFTRRTDPGSTRCACLVALAVRRTARKLCEEAVAAYPSMTLTIFLDKERFRDSAIHRQLGERLIQAGLPT